MSSERNKALLERIIKLEESLYAQYKETTHARINVCKFEQQLEATQAELAAERAKPKGGVAWALKHKYKDEFWLFSSGCKYLYETKEAANSHLNRAMSGTIWEPVPYPIGDGADELKAAIEAKEKAEAEAAAWKEAANHAIQTQGMVPVRTPEGLRSRFDDLIAWVTGYSDRTKKAEAEIAALKAAPHATEPPPLDKWRVLATAKSIADTHYARAKSDSPSEYFWVSLNTFIDGICMLEYRRSPKPYPLQD